MIESGAEFLDDLRRRYSIRFLNDMMALGGTARFMPSTSSPDAAALRRDTCGIPVGRPIRNKRTDDRMEVVARIHDQLRSRGAALEDDHYVLDGRTIRVINGGGRMLNSVRSLYNIEPPTREPDYTICAGAVDDGGAPPHLLRSTATPSLVRPGSTASWVTRADEVPGGMP